MPEIKISDLLKDFGQLSEEQYRTCRDAGYSANELSKKTNRWYQNIHNTVTFDSSDADALPKQLEYLEASGITLDVDHLSYSQARKAIRELAKLTKDDSRYLEIIAKYEEHDRARATRKQKGVTAKATLTRPSSAKHARYPLMDLQSPDEPHDGEGHDDEQDAFFQQLKANRQQRNI